VTVLPEGADLPTERDPMKALVLVPADGEDGASASPPASTSGTAAEDPTWVFPFDRPLPPDEGDTQAMAVNTTDNSVRYDVAMAMVWVDDPGEERVVTSNEAIAYASCSDCVTVAVSFQVLVIVGEAEVIVPQNTSEALNYDCFRCITAAVAKQLVITVEEMPGQDKQVLLSDIWGQLADFATTMPSLPLSQVLDRLEEFEEQIKAVLTDAVAEAPQAAAPSPRPETAVDPGGGEASGATTSPAPTDGASASSGPSPSQGPSPSGATGEPTSGASPSPASPTPSATASPTG
jgi:putative peptide zinc metalloprotease protein